MFPQLSMTIGIVFIISNLLGGFNVLILGLGVFLFSIGFYKYKRPSTK